MDQRELTEAERLLAHALVIWEKVLGADDLKVADTLDAMTTLNNDRRTRGNMEPLLKRSLVICEKKLGVDHLGLVKTLSNLARYWW